MPNTHEAGGISRRIDGDDRSHLKEAMSGLTPENGGLNCFERPGVWSLQQKSFNGIWITLNTFDLNYQSRNRRKPALLIYQEK